MTDKRRQYRHELKYLISYPEAELLKSRIRPLMKPDEHTGTDAEYTVRSLYFDDYFDTAFREKEAGVYARKKYRIRLYDLKEDYIRLERKSKLGEYVTKQGAMLSKEDVLRIVDGDFRFLEQRKENLLKEFYYELSGRLLRPRVIVEYEREPYLYVDTDIRITFDKHVRVTGTPDLFDPEPALKEAMPPDRLILEVKYNRYLPDHLRRILIPKGAQQTSASKFMMGCRLCPRETSPSGRGTQLLSTAID